VAFEESIKEALAPPPVREVRQEKQRAGWFAWLRPAFASPVFATALLAGLGLESAALFRTSGMLAEVSAPRIVATSVLRGETRGEATKVVASKGQPLWLTFDFVPKQVYSNYKIEVKSAAGATVSEFTQAIPEGDESKALSLPRPDLEPGLYVITIYGVTPTGEISQPVSRYPFQIFPPESHAR
jgi:hypothetical protein